jgi:hypothetical protein
MYFAKRSYCPGRAPGEAGGQPRAPGRSRTSPGAGHTGSVSPPTQAPPAAGTTGPPLGPARTPGHRRIRTFPAGNNRALHRLGPAHRRPGVPSYAFPARRPTPLRRADGPAGHPRLAASTSSGCSRAHSTCATRSPNCARNCAISSSWAAHNTQPGQEAATRTRATIIQAPPRSSNRARRPATTPSATEHREIRRYRQRVNVYEPRRLARLTEMHDFTVKMDQHITLGSDDEMSDL